MSPKKIEELEEIESEGAPIVSDEDRKMVSKIKKRFEEGMDYKASQGYLSQWAEYDRFWEGDQWPTPTKKNKDYPRPVTNHFASIIEQKVAGVTYEEPEFYFDPVGNHVIPNFSVYKMGSGGQDIEELKVTTIDAAEVLSHIAKREWHRLDMSDLVEEGARSAAVLGPGIWFIPWDDSVVGGTEGSFYVGNVAVHEVDPVNFIPGDPSLPPRAMQRQPWIIMVERMTVSEAKECYKEHSPELVDYIKSDDQLKRRSNIYSSKKIEQGDNEYVTVLHCWWKEYDDEYEEEDFEEYEEDEKEEQEEEQERLKESPVNLKYRVAINDFIIRSEDKLYKSGLYPFAAFNWLPRRGCFFGKPEAKDLINNQKEENRLAGVSLLSIYQSGVPNVRIKTSFVNRHSIPAGPGGGVIEDNSPPGYWAVEYMTPPSPAPNIPQLREAIVANMKDTSGVHEAWSGKAPGARLNASAILALQEAAGIRIRGVQRRLMRAIKDMGYIFLNHWKEFYTESRMFKIVKENNIEGFIWFKATDLQDMEFDITVRADAASPFNKSLLSQQLDNLLEKAVITPEEYLENVPTNIFPLADKILHKREQRMKEEQQRRLEHKSEIIRQIIETTLNKARDQGMDVTPEVWDEMMRMLSKAEEEMEAAEEEAAEAL